MLTSYRPTKWKGKVRDHLLKVGVQWKSAAKLLQSLMYWKKQLREQVVLKYQLFHTSHNRQGQLRLM